MRGVTQPLLAFGGTEARKILEFGYVVKSVVQGQDEQRLRRCEI